MTSVRDHYDKVLAEHYSRMFGDFEAKVAEQRALLERLGIRAVHRAETAIDLGCGSGFQSVALARLGFHVIAIDFSQRLLAELKDRARGLPVETIAGDICDVATLVPKEVGLAVCMGDTLSHLEREPDLARVFEGVATRLATGGRLVLTFRDLSGELRNLDRALPVYAADELVMTCFLEYEPRAVKVHDLIWVRENDGWRFRKGVYRKLRLAPAEVTKYLERAGFTVEQQQAPAGMIALVGISVGPRRS